MKREQVQPPALAVKDLSKSFRKGKEIKEVLKGISFEVANQQVVCLLGANGAGKTTLVNIASTLLLPTSGVIEVCGANVVTQPAKVRSVIALTGQFAAVDQELTGMENLVFFGRLRGLRPAVAKERATDLLAEFRLTDAANQRVANYSGGMRRRLDIAASLVVEPRLLFLDEPTTGLDPLSRRELWQTVEQLKERGVSVLLTTQYLDEAERLADVIVLIREGSVVLQGSPTEVRRQFGNSICTISFDSVAEAQRGANEILPKALSIDHKHLKTEGLDVSFVARDGTSDLVVALSALHAAGLLTNSAAVNPPSLDDVFLGTAFGENSNGQFPRQGVEI